MAVQITPALESKLERLAALDNSTCDALAQDALDRFVAYREELSASIRQAEENADRNGWLTSEEVLERIRKRFTAA